MFYPTLKYSQSITISSAYIPATVTNVPIFLTDQNFSNDFLTLNGPRAPNSSGSDIRFFSDSGLNTPIAFDLIYFTPNANPANTEVGIVVNVPSLSSTSNTVIYVGWGDGLLGPLSASSTYGQYNAYPSGFKFWYAMLDSTDTSHILDRTINQLSGIKTGAANPTYGQASGVNTEFDYQDFKTANTSHIQIPAVTAGNRFTVFCPFHYDLTSAPAYDRLISNKRAYNDTNGFEINLFSGSTTQLQVGCSGVTQWNPTVFTNVTSDSWEWTAVKFDTTHAAVFVDATKMADTTAAGVVNAIVDTTNTITFGNNSAFGEQGFDGSMSIMALYSGNLSDAYIQVMQNNQYRSTNFGVPGSTNSLQVLPNGWRMRATLGINHNQVGGSTLTNFPMFLKWDGTQANSNLPANMFSGSVPAQSTGADIRFSTDTLGLNQISFEVVSFSTTSPGAAEIWTKVPSISASSDTTIYAWWGNALASALAVTDTYGRNAVWSDYSAVWHFENSFVNAAGFPQWDATNSGTSDVTGAYYPGRGRHFDTSNYIWANDPTLNLSQGTWQAWVQPYSQTQQQYAKILLKDLTTSVSPYTPWDLSFDGSSGANQTFKVETAVGATQFGAISNVLPTPRASYYQMVGRYDGAHVSVWIDGTSRGSTAQTGTLISNIEPINMGRQYYGGSVTGQYWNGGMDEVRISGQARPDGWILAEYNNAVGPTSFSSFTSSKYNGPVEINIKRSSRRSD
jgi:hypothetical protein